MLMPNCESLHVHDYVPYILLAYLAGCVFHIDPFNLTDVKVTTKELGRGAFGVVKVLYFKGLKCAGKIIYKDLCEKNSHIITRYEKECLLLSQLHHPNIVQFLGTYSENASDLPVMVMELLATNLSGCLATYEILPEEVSATCQCKCTRINYAVRCLSAYCVKVPLIFCLVAFAYILRRNCVYKLNSR